MMDFFANDFNQEKWKKAALKNAFVLLGKQRFEHAVAFFLLGGALNDALQVSISLKTAGFFFTKNAFKCFYKNFSF